MPSTMPDKTLARRVLNCQTDAMDAAISIVERHDPATLAEATRLVQAHGPLSPAAYERLTQAFDRHWVLRDMPCND